MRGSGERPHELARAAMPRSRRSAPHLQPGPFAAPESFSAPAVVEDVWPGVARIHAQNVGPCPELIVSSAELTRHDRVRAADARSSAVPWLKHVASSAVTSSQAAAHQAGPAPGGATTRCLPIRSTFQRSGAKPELPECHRIDAGPIASHGNNPAHDLSGDAIAKT
jgi:hypothetical protein